MNSSDPSITDPAMAVIRRYDPTIYREIVASPWKVYVADSTPGNIIMTLPPDIYEAIVADFNDNRALADTLAENSHYENKGIYVPPQYCPYGRTTWLNMPLLRAACAQQGIPLADQVADTLVHEFAHYTLGFGAGERPAYIADLAFARKLPAGDHVIVTAAQKGLEDYS